MFREGEFDIVIDSGLFHALSDKERMIFVSNINYVLLDNGSYFMVCFSYKEPPEDGPRQISKIEIKQTFSSKFKIKYIRPTFFDSIHKNKDIKAYVTLTTKIC